MKRMLYVSNPKRTGGIGGREQLSRLHRNALREIYGDSLETIELAGTAGVARLWGHIDGVSASSIETVTARASELGVERIFLDGSNLGVLAKAIRKAIPAVEIVTFFHNCEARFFYGAIKQSWSIRSVGVLFANFIAERNAVRFSDKLISLNARDSAALESVYGRRATHLLPMALEDKVPRIGSPSKLPMRQGQYILFVGGAFYANIQGITWFCKNVAPFVAAKTVVVGRGFDEYREQLEQCGNVEVAGSVDELCPWYSGARYVVAPIFDGSGMKTKVAEALMYGKRVIGTPEAFIGYEGLLGRFGTVCNNANDFIRELNSLAKDGLEGEESTIRALYEEHYSLTALQKRLREILSFNEAY
jgi:glycosyltransferase involved in cell wall biosynthesis